MKYPCEQWTGFSCEQSNNEMNKFKNHKGLIFICKHKYAAVDLIINVGFEFQIVLKYKILELVVLSW